MSTINFVNALCGAGKTTAAINWSVEKTLKYAMICIVQPTKHLINQTYTDLLQIENADQLSIYKITSDTHPNNVVSQIDFFLKNFSEPGTILLITTESYKSLNYFNKADEWIMIFDEIPNPFEYGEIKCKKTLSKTLQGIEKKSINQVMTELSFPKFEPHILKDCSNDDSLKPYERFSKFLQNDKYNVYVKTSDYDKLFLRNNQKSLHYLAILNPQSLLKFKQVIVMGALFHESFFKLICDHYSYTTDEKITLVEHTQIKEKLYNNTLIHNNLGILKIIPAYEIPWSKTFFNKSIPGKNIRYIDEFVDAINQCFLENKFLLSINNDQKDLISRMPNAIKVSGSPYGINEYKNFNLSAYIAANNPHPQFYILLKAFGIDSNLVKKQLHFHNAYQFLLRTCLRDSTSMMDSIIIVPTLELAEYLRALFSNVVIEKLQGTTIIGSNFKKGRKKLQAIKSSAQRTAHSRRKEEIACLNELNSNINYNTNIIKGKKVTKYSLDTMVTFLIFPNKYSNVEESVSTQCTVQEMLEKWEYFIEIGRDHAIETGKVKKDDHCLISTANFKGKRRLLSEVQSIFGIWLDFDGGDFSKEDLKDLFPDNYILVYNSFTTEENRFRAFFPTDKLLTPWAFKDICRTISAMIEDNGYKINPNEMKEGDKICKLDTGKFNAAALFYAPRESEHKKRGSNFYKYQKGEFLDVDYFLNYPMHQDEYELVVKNSTNEILKETISNNNELILLFNKHIELYRSLAKDTDTRHRGFFILAVSLSYLTKDEFEIRRQLKLADLDGSRGEKGVNDCIRSLYKYGRL